MSPIISIITHVLPTNIVKIIRGIIRPAILTPIGNRTYVIVTNNRYKSWVVFYPDFLSIADDTYQRNSNEHRYFNWHRISYADPQLFSKVLGFCDESRHGDNP